MIIFLFLKALILSLIGTASISIIYGVKDFNTLIAANGILLIISYIGLNIQAKHNAGESLLEEKFDYAERRFTAQIERFNSTASKIFDELTLANTTNNELKSVVISNLGKSNESMLKITDILQSGNNFSNNNIDLETLEDSSINLNENILNFDKNNSKALLEILNVLNEVSVNNAEAYEAFSSSMSNSENTVKNTIKDVSKTLSMSLNSLNDNLRNSNLSIIKTVSSFETNLNNFYNLYEDNIKLFTDNIIQIKEELANKNHIDLISEESLDIDNNSITLDSNILENVILIKESISSLNNNINSVSNLASEELSIAFDNSIKNITSLIKENSNSQIDKLSDIFNKIDELQLDINVLDESLKQGYTDSNKTIKKISDNTDLINQSFNEKATNFDTSLVQLLSSTTDINKFIQKNSRLICDEVTELKMSFEDLNTSTQRFNRNCTNALNMINEPGMYNQTNDKLYIKDIQGRLNELESLVKEINISNSTYKNDIINNLMENLSLASSTTEFKSKE